MGDPEISLGRPGRSVKRESWRRTREFGGLGQGGLQRTCDCTGLRAVLVGAVPVGAAHGPHWGLHVCLPQAARGPRGLKGEKGEPAVLEPVSHSGH